MVYTESELWLHVRQERAKLVHELGSVEAEERALSKRRQRIADRLAELDKAEDILEGGL